MKETGRNDPCPCGSQKKYKQCCLRATVGNAAGDGGKAMGALMVAQAFEAALTAHRAGDLLRAELLCREILKGEPRHADALHLLGMTAFQTGRPEAAVDWIRRALRSDRTNPHYHGNLGIALHSLDNLDEAVACYREALALKPDFAEVYGNLGKALRDQRKTDDAIDCCRKAIALRPDLTEAVNNLGNALMDQQRLDEAIGCYRRVVEAEPRHAEAHYNWANALHQQGSRDEAVIRYRSALSLKPNLLQARLNLGNALLERGDLDEAEACYRAALAIDPSFAQAHLNLGNLLLEQGRAAEAIECLRTALSLDPDSVTAWISTGDAFRERGDTERAIRCYERAIGIDPGNVVAVHLLTALRGGESPCSPVPYVVHLFDHMAGTFDAHLVDRLHYSVPQGLAKLVGDFAPTLPDGGDLLDLGCGTGLAGAAMARYARRMVGIDLSSRMLEKAREKGLYERLEHSELLAMMRKEPEASFDLIVAADLFIYIGEIDAVMAEARRLLRRDGLFAFSIEALASTADYRLMPTTRYAHSTGYIDRLATQNRFTVERMVSAPLRLENDLPVPGWLFLLQHGGRQPG